MQKIIVMYVYEAHIQQFIQLLDNGKKLTVKLDKSAILPQEV